ncbi:MAG: AraC family transcriptional regulator [Chthoniobacteraceae bacterium]|nr:AraC family transcriptional regulator [Chthoniobacteraceae bacterium]
MKFDILNPSGWNGALTAPQTRVAVRMMNFPFRFLAPEGWDTGDVFLGEHLVYFAGRGSCRVVFGGRERELKAGEVCWANPGTRIRLYRRGPQPELFRFRFSVTAGGASLRLPWDCRVGRFGAEALDWARRWVEEWERPGCYAQARMKALAALFSVAFFEGTRRGGRSEARGLPRERCAELADWVARHPSSRLRPPDLARRCGLSADYFTRLFRQAFGVSPKAWILKQRLSYAAGMLAESDRSVSAIAAELAYNDVYLFSRQFRKEFGASPRAWRKQHRAAHTARG